MKFLDNDFQRVSTNRFVVDSDRFWRKEFHPRFSDMFDEDMFTSVFIKVNYQLSFKFEQVDILEMGRQFYLFFAPYRFCLIPSKESTQSDDKFFTETQQYLADLRLNLLDYLPQISIKNIKVTDEDFSTISKRAESGKVDSTRLNIKEEAVNKSNSSTLLSKTVNKTDNTNDTVSKENSSDETNQNVNNVSDTYLSPQDQGLQSTTENIKGEGVDGLKIPKSSEFITATTTNLSGDTATNIGINDSTSNIKFSENVDNSRQEIGEIYNSDLAESKDSGIENVKNDLYVESSDFDKGGSLNKFYNLNNDRLWLELLTVMSRWVLRMDISTSEENFVNQPRYK